MLKQRPDFDEFSEAIQHLINILDTELDVENISKHILLTHHDDFLQQVAKQVLIILAYNKCDPDNFYSDLLPLEEVWENMEYS